MADRFGASSLAALLAVAGMVGLGVVSYRALNGAPSPACVTTAAETCPLLGDDCSMVEKRTSCCSSKAEDVDTCDGDKAEKLASCHHDGDDDAHNGGNGECKGLKDGCTGNGEDGCCGACDEETDCDHNGTTCSEKAATCAEKAECAEKAATCSSEKKAECAEKAATCSEKAEKPRTCCSQRSN